MASWSLLLLAVCIGLLEVTTVFAFPLVLLRRSHYNRLFITNADVRAEVQANGTLTAQPRSSRQYFIERMIIQSLFVTAAATSAIVSPSITYAIPSLPSRTKAAESFGAVGYEAVESAFSPMQTLYAVPSLPQSALLNTLPINRDLFGQLQALLESFTQLMNPSKQQQQQINQNNSALWTNLRVNAQRAAGMFLYNKEVLSPIVVDSESVPMQLARQQLGNFSIESLQENLIKLVNSSRASDVVCSLQCMQLALNNLVMIAACQVPLRTTSFDRRFDIENRFKKDAVAKQLKQLPYLRGRAVVKMTVTLLRRSKPNSANETYIQRKSTGAAAEAFYGTVYPLPSLRDNATLIARKDTEREGNFSSIGHSSNNNKGGFPGSHAFFERLPLSTQALPSQVKCVACKGL